MTAASRPTTRRAARLVWQFQTGVSGGGPVMSYEVDGEQYVAFASTSVWAFKLDGALEAGRTATPRPPDESVRRADYRHRPDRNRFAGT